MVNRLRLISQHIMFIILMYGGRIGIHLGYSLPCLSCPYVAGCGGNCYLMALQHHWGFGIAFADILGMRGLEVLFKFLVFLVLVSVLSKIWCGWICPFCTFQDWITLLRKKLHVREAEFSQATRKSLKPIKYILLAYLVIVPVLVTNAGLHSDFSLPFCQICPAKPIMPLFVLETKYLSLNFTNAITLTFSILSIVIAAGMLVGMFFKERFFCMICPMLALIHIFKRISFIKFHKSPATCVSCGNCHRMCPVDIPDVSREKKNRDVMGEDCMLCMKCVESCPENNVLTVKFLNFRIFSSSQKYVAKYFK